ncbi:membrane protein [Salmonella enterica subsp. enterica]|nr:membrane protein [Salmonella enterica subsp. enterica]
MKMIVIADDFTGSNDTGVQLAKKGGENGSHVERVAKTVPPRRCVSH